MDAVRNDRRDPSPATFQDPALAPPAGVAAAQKTLAASEPWSDITQYLPDSKTTLSAKFFANRAFLAGAVPLPSNPVPPALMGALPPLPPSGDAVHGVLSAADGPTLPPTTCADISRSRYAGDYRLHPQVQVDETGTARVAYWSAYNTREKRTDFYVGPDNLDAFENHPATFAEIAARVPVGGLENWEVESARTVGSLLAGQPAQAAAHLGRSWGEAITNTRFIEKTVANTVLSLAGATALDDLKAAQELDGTAARSQLRGSPAANRDGIGLHEYQPNANGAVRSTEEARAIAKAHGVELPDWIEIRANPRVPIDQKLAAYRLGGPAPLPPLQLANWDRLAPDDVVVVNVHPSVFASDEAIVGVLAHEGHELTSLQASVEQNSMRYRDVQSAIDPASNDNLHGQAWDVADLQVMRMRAQTPAARAAIDARLSNKLSTFDVMNGIER